MRLSKTIIHENQLSASRSAPQRELAHLVLDTAISFIDGFIPPPPSGVCLDAASANHGFADSPVALFRHPLRGFVWTPRRLTTGSRTHPWLYPVTPFGGLFGRRVTPFGVWIAQQINFSSQDFQPAGRSW